MYYKIEEKFGLKPYLEKINSKKFLTTIFNKFRLKEVKPHQKFKHNPLSIFLKILMWENYRIK